MYSDGQLSRYCETIKFHKEMDLNFRIDFTPSDQDSQVKTLNRSKSIHSSKITNQSRQKTATFLPIFRRYLNMNVLIEEIFVELRGLSEKQTASCLVCKTVERNVTNCLTSQYGLETVTQENPCVGICQICQLFPDKLGNEEEDQVAVMCDLESIITFYCKSRNVKFEEVSQCVNRFLCF